MLKNRLVTSHPEQSRVTHLQKLRAMLYSVSFQIKYIYALFIMFIRTHSMAWVNKYCWDYCCNEYQFIGIFIAVKPECNHAHALTWHHVCKRKYHECITIIFALIYVIQCDYLFCIKYYGLLFFNVMVVAYQGVSCVTD